jgi:hypothetical protein
MKPRSDKTEIRYLRTTLRNAGSLLALVVGSNDREQAHLAYVRRSIREALAPKPRRKS